MYDILYADECCVSGVCMYIKGTSLLYDIHT